MDDDRWLTTWQAVLLSAFVGALIWVGAFCGVKAALADHLMCSQGKTATTLRVYIAPELRPMAYWSFWQWNSLFWNYYGKDIFAETPNPADADASIVPGPTTWVNGPCTGGPRVVNFAPSQPDPQHWMTHELGHILGFADHIYPWQSATGYINPGVACGAYFGVMDYCTSEQMWFRCFEGISDDCDMVQGYWRN